MSRLKRNRNIDDLVNAIEAVKSKCQCSLSEQDLTVLNDAIARLRPLKSRKGLTDKHLKQEVEKIVEVILVYFLPTRNQSSI
ncbi:hypothetical protein SAMN04487935_1611 [Flavobacterium noncentrifugens]|uniref:Uncharacterized protein n=1 Tax=Flavobacterium noncentrifugens TaxID=1128970 RepID=A0A1G8W3W2_9FLAO|nr:hypothetical protein SAMN04487935_1611 [Flavobacterium noncentrifugens]